MTGNRFFQTFEGLNGIDRIDGGDGDFRDEIFGGTGDDLIFGGAHADIIRGGDGDDRIPGQSLGDDMSGGAGGDEFFITRDAGDHIIRDFEAGFLSSEVSTSHTLALHRALPHLQLLKTTPMGMQC